MKKYLSVAISFIMAATVFVIPFGSVYAEGAGEGMQDQTQITEEAVVDEPEATDEEQAGTPDMEAEAPAEEQGITEEDPQQPQEAAENPEITLAGGRNNSIPAKVTGLKVVSVSATRIKVSWDASVGADGYYLARKVEGHNYPKNYETANTSFTFHHIIPAKKYTIRVIAYNAYGESSETVIGAETKSFSKPKVKTRRGENLVKVRWTAVKGDITGYQVKAGKKMYRFTKKSTLSRKMKKLKGNKKYSIRVRAYIKVKGKRYYGPWSKVKYSRPYGRINTYSYISKGGVYACDKGMWERVKNATSNTKYLICINRDKCRFYVYKGRAGHWENEYVWLCTTGGYQGHVTPMVNLLTPGSKKPYFNGFGYPRHGVDREYTCWYATRFIGSCFVHSTIYAAGSKTVQFDSELGRPKSHGCVRLHINNARWVYNNINGGTRFIVYE